MNGRPRKPRASLRQLLRPRQARPALTVEAGLASVLAALPDGVVIFDAAGRLVTANAAALRLTGLGSIDALRRAMADAAAVLEVHSPAGEPVAAEHWPIARAVRGETYFDLRLRVRAFGEEERVISFTGGPARAPAGEAGYAVVSMRDVTREDERELESERLLEQCAHEHERGLETTAALREATAVLALVAEAMPIGIVVAEATGRVVLWNSAAGRLLGGRAPHLEDIPARCTLHAGGERIAAARDLPLVRALREGRPTEAVFMRPGTAAPVLVRAHPVVDAGGRAAAVVGIFLELPEE
ncbi:MAG TPA: PAS domain-containing protein [Polyangia bacterium]